MDAVSLDYFSEFWESWYLQVLLIIFLCFCKKKKNTTENKKQKNPHRCLEFPTLSFLPSSQLIFGKSDKEILWD